MNKNEVDAILGRKGDLGDIAIESFDEVQVENAEDEFSVEAEIMIEPEEVSIGKPVYINW